MVCVGVLRVGELRGCGRGCVWVVCWFRRRWLIAVGLVLVLLFGFVVVLGVLWVLSVIRCAFCCVSSVWSVLGCVGLGLGMM